ncbi:asparagine synthase (glutamine-hydrolyzing) [Minwuia thermotolerans]|uniref:asparagine synthase (glutamine-hydrolyzing) n=1 Tax=Minwuia thermotolerans TaxID=2056226 RepID=A0A2M9FW03_9PROT|nr:asparagine synthase (glutamine-hydrolyzing) [Minwuia thermotolerans]PJK27658.1 asparagine synthase (glutamine-hydrolyzing) [Minwuia thermotolerans]
MCGIAGLLAKPGTGTDWLAAGGLEKMAARLFHRGPDDHGLWIDVSSGIGLAHRRLAVIDLSAAGAQPMASCDGRLVLVYNGEIYNHLDLRDELAVGVGSIAWRGHSDTETLLMGICRWGLAETLRKAAGMFALALWDSREGVLSLARDRMGEKPLHVAKLKKGWAFASELQAFRAVPDFAPVLDGGALTEFLATGVVSDRMCIWKDVRKVRPGSILQIKPQTGEERIFDYNSFTDLVRAGRNGGRRGRIEPNPADKVEEVLKNVIRSQMISDVPLGCFLSGGIDSSLVAALMRQCADRPIRTFTIAFDDFGYDESVHAERIAEHLGMDHNTYRLHEEDALEIIPDLGRVYGEAFADSSQIPTLLLCRRAREHVTVALTGDGGDEIFGGYNRHVMVPRLWARMARIPAPLRRHAGFIGKIIQRVGGGSSGVMRALVRRAGLPTTTLDRASRFGEIAARATSFAELYWALTRHMDDPTLLLASPETERCDFAPPGLDELVPEEWLMAMDTLTYLPGDILVKVDRAAMSASLETRAPYLDRRTVEAAWSLPLEARIRNGNGKRVLRDILYRYVPQALLERPKQGFAVPIDRWLRGPLMSWADKLLSRDLIEEYGVLASEPVEMLWSVHKKNRANHGATLWSLLMLQAWLQEQAAQAECREVVIL